MSRFLPSIEIHQNPYIEPYIGIGRMAKKIHRLTALQVKKNLEPGWYPDGQGLYLQVSQSGSKSWVYRYEKVGKERRHGPGSFLYVSLQNARIAAEHCRKLRRQGIDPIDHKRQLEATRRLEDAKGITFRECALAYIKSHKAGWKNSKHASQWHNTLETYAFPVIGKLSVQDIDVGLVLKVLEPIWLTKTETATRVRQRIENILDWAKAKNYRTGENPAQWRGHLDKLLAKPTKVQKVKHFNAMPYAELPDYFRNLRTIDTQTAKALAFTILTASRSNEAREARWSEIDLQAGTWIIPEERMKAGRPHRVPLTQEAIQILKDAERLKVDDHVFPGHLLFDKAVRIWLEVMVTLDGIGAGETGDYVRVTLLQIPKIMQITVRKDNETAILGFSIGAGRLLAN